MSLIVASGSYDKTIKFWDLNKDVSKQHLEINLQQRKLIPLKIQISLSKQKFIVGMYGTCHIYDLMKHNILQHQFSDMFQGNVIAVGFQKNQNIVYTGCQDGSLRIFDLRQKGLIKKLDNKVLINCAVMHPNDVEILSGDDKGCFKIWDIASSKQRFSISNDNDSAEIISISVSRNGQNLIFGDQKGSIQPFCIQKGQYLRKCKSLNVHNSYINNVEISQDGKYLSTCSADKSIKLYKINDVEKFQIVQYKVLQGHGQWVWGTKFSCDSQYLISCSTDKRLKLWGVKKGELIKTIIGHEKGVICLALNDL